MSYDLGLYYPNHTPARVDRREDGGTYALGGSDEACLNITYNYSKFFKATIDDKLGIRWLYGKTGKETEEVLAEAVASLGTKQSKDYWEATPGNAGYALSILLLWAKQHPDAVWNGD